MNQPWQDRYCLCRTEYGCLVHAEVIRDGLAHAERWRVSKIAREWFADLDRPEMCR